MERLQRERNEIEKQQKQKLVDDLLKKSQAIGLKVKENVEFSSFFFFSFSFPFLINLS